MLPAIVKLNPTRKSYNITSDGVDTFEIKTNTIITEVITDSPHQWDLLSDNGDHASGIETVKELSFMPSSRVVLFTVPGFKFLIITYTFTMPKNLAAPAYFLCKPTGRYKKLQ